MIAVLLPLALAVAGCGGGDETVTETVTVTVDESGEPAPPSSDASASDASGTVGDQQTYTNVDQIELNGEPVDVTLEVRVSDLRADVESPQFLPPSSGMKHVRMTVGIRNVGNDAYTPSGEFQVVTRSGESASFQSLGGPGDLGPAAVRPGGLARGNLWAEVPKNAVVDQIIFAPFGGDPETDLVWEAG